MFQILKRIIPFKKKTRRILKKIRKVEALLFPLDISNRKLLKIINKNNKEHITKYLRNKSGIKFFIDLGDKRKIIEAFMQGFSDRIRNVLENANEIYNHTFDLLGSGKINLGEKINWHCDFKSGYCWNPKTFYLDIKYGDRSGVDVKVPWELSRFQHMPTLGEAYWLTGDEKYTEEFVAQIEDWIDSNLIGYGVNWTCTMDVAIRACNWILGFCFFRSSKEINDKFLIKFSKSLLLHGKHIEKNLEKGWRGLTSNHYLSDIVGLVYLGIFFKNTKQGKKWLNFGIQELKKEMEKQVYPDGCDFEASTCYHRLVLELFFFSTLLTVINDERFNGENYQRISEKIFGKEYTERLYRMFEAVLYLLKPNGKMPQIGDNDNGRLHIFANREILDMRYLLTLGGIFFEEPRFKVKEFGFSEEALWMFGKRGYRLWQNLKENNLSKIKSKSFPEAGWYVMRDNKDYCIISCGPNGQNRNGGHCHNDKLSFELMINGKDIIVDPGTYIYTPNPILRDKFRSTNYHNTLTIDNKEQNRFIKNNIFSLRKDTNCKCLEFGEDKNKMWFNGEHTGYERLKNPIIHHRRIFFSKLDSFLEIQDYFTGKGRHDSCWNLNLKSSLDKLGLIIESDNLNFKRTIGYYSPKYGARKEIRRLIAYSKIKDGDSFKINIKS